MSAEHNKFDSLEERIARCPIHNWTDVDRYLEILHVPQHLWKPFHEIVLLRGQLPKHGQSGQSKDFGRQANQITYEYNMSKEESNELSRMFRQLLELWLGYNSHLN